MQLIFSTHHMLLWSVCVWKLCHHWSHSASLWFRNAVWVCFSGITRLGVGCMWLGSLISWLSHEERTELGLHIFKATYILLGYTEIIVFFILPAGKQHFTDMFFFGQFEVKMASLWQWWWLDRERLSHSCAVAFSWNEYSQLKISTSEELSAFTISSSLSHSTQIMVEGSSTQEKSADLQSLV